MKALLIVLIVFATNTLVNSAPSSANNKSAVEALEQCVTLLQEEELRWKTIHTNPVTDVITVTKDGDNLQVNVTLDTSVKNIINDMPIQRQYTLIPNKYNYWAPFDLMVSGSLISTTGWRPCFGLGYAPEFAHNFGITANTTLMNINIGAYYKIPMLPCVFIQAMLGLTFTGAPTVGLGLGVRL